MRDENRIVRYKTRRFEEDEFEEDEREAKLAKTKETITPSSSKLLSKNPHKALHTSAEDGKDINSNPDKYEAEFNSIKGGFLKMQKILISVFDPSTSYYLSSLLEWRKFLKDKKRMWHDGSFFIIQGRIRKFYFLSIQRQKTARQKLEKSGVLIVKRGRGKGRTKVNFYEIDFERLCSLIDPKVLTMENQWKTWL